MRINYNPTYSDYLAFQTYFFVKLYKFILGFAVLVPLIHFITLILPPQVSGADTAAEPEHFNAMVLILPGIVIYLIGVTYWTVKKRWANASDLREPREYEIDDTGIRITATTFNSFTKWDHIKAAEITKRFTYLKTAQNIFYYIPNEAIADLPQLCELIISKVDKVKICKAISSSLPR